MAIVFTRIREPMNILESGMSFLAKVLKKHGYADNGYYVP
jgi:hypothetical protein